MEVEHEGRDDVGATGKARWGIPASILLHAVFAFALFFQLPHDVPVPQQEESVNVEIVEAPEEPEQAAEETPLEMPKPEEKQAEQPKTEDMTEEAPPPPPPVAEPAPEQEVKPEEPPPQPAPAEQPVPEQSAAEQPPAEQSTGAEPPGDAQAQGRSMPVLRPVFEFGEEDSGPRKSETGNASTERAIPLPETAADAPAPDMPTQDEDAPPVPDMPVEDAEASPVPDMPAGNSVPDDINLPGIDAAATHSQQDGAPPGPQSVEMGTQTITSLPMTQPRAEPAERPKELTEAKTLFSRQMADSPVATTAMAGIPRGTRAGQLCSTELREQLRHASYAPDFLPAPRLPSGTVLDVKSAGFRARGQWYDLQFRCEIDENATKVLSFAFDVGAPVPRGEWRKRGFPEF